MNDDDLKLLQLLDEQAWRERARTVIDSIVQRVEKQLQQDPHALMAWEPIPLAAYASLPERIRSSWVFILRAGAATGAERHPNSHQRVMSYRSSGDLQVWIEGVWRSHPLVSDLHVPLENRWASIPPLTWHQAVVPNRNWVVVSFHTVAASELIEERPDPSCGDLPVQRTYL